MEAPKITVVRRNIESKNWPNGFDTWAVKYSDGSYSSDYGLEDKHIEIVEYEGTLPEQAIIQPRIDINVLWYGFGTIFMEIPKVESKELSALRALRDVCDHFFGDTVYTKDGFLESTVFYRYSESKDAEEIYNYITQLINVSKLGRT